MAIVATEVVVVVVVVVEAATGEARGESVIGWRGGGGGAGVSRAEV